MNIGELKEVCRKVRIDILDSIYGAGSGHIGGSFSMVEIFVALYCDVMNIDPQNPKMKGRDRFVLSKGHACPCLYAVLAERGYFDKEELKRERKFHSILQGHPDSKKCPGVEASSGSLGQGISHRRGHGPGRKTDWRRVPGIHGDRRWRMRGGPCVGGRRSRRPLQIG